MDSRLSLALLALLVLAACGGPEVQHGDAVLVTYVGRFQNGTIFDTNDPSLKSEVPDSPASKFTPYPVRIGSGQVVPGFEQALLGMNEGETKTVKIKALEAYGAYDDRKILRVPKQAVFPREITFKRDVAIPRSQFRGNATAGHIFETENFDYNVTGSNASHVFAYVLNATVDPIHLEELNWNSTLVRETPEEMVYRHLVDTGDEFLTQQGPYNATVNGTAIVLDSMLEIGREYASERGNFRVSREASDSLVLDFNHPLAGLDLNFTITVNSVQSRR